MRSGLRDEIMRLSRDDGVVFPRDVVEYARKDKQSALHAEFNWNVREAAYQHWLDTARRLIQLHVVNDAGQRQTVSLVIERPDGGGYRPVAQVLASTEFRQAAVDQALAELPRWCERYGYLAELQPVRLSVERAIHQFRLSPPDKEAAD